MLILNTRARRRTCTSIGYLKLVTCMVSLICSSLGTTGIKKIISEFYSTLFYDKKERIFMWMNNGRRFHVRLAQFAQILGLSSQLDIPKKLHSEWVMMPREMTPMYIQDGGFQPPKVEGLLPHFLVLHWMMRRTLAPRIGYSEAITA
jgi:hypothetical protein